MQQDELPVDNIDLQIAKLFAEHGECNPETIPCCEECDCLRLARHAIELTQPLWD